MANKYTQEELDFIRDNYKAMTYEEIGKKLGRSKESVQNESNKIETQKTSSNCDSEIIKGEIWKSIKGYEGLYIVSNFGRVKSLKRLNKNNVKVDEKLLKLASDKKGYKMVFLYKNGKRKTQKVHRLVAEEFIPNPNNYPQVNHKDENKSNNYVNNLEWCTSKYNANYGNHNEKISNSNKKPVSKYNMKNQKIESYSSVKEAAAKNGLNGRCIARCARGERPHYMGFIWKYDIDKDCGIKRVVQYDLNFNEMAIFKSASYASKVLGIPSRHINTCCKLKSLSSKKYNSLWRFENEI